jgi:hypothetical protein
LPRLIETRRRIKPNIVSKMGIALPIQGLSAAKRLLGAPPKRKLAIVRQVVADLH